MSQSKFSKPFSHASHNYEVCYKLKGLGKCDDWVVTTAFYSGMKFLEDKLFPGDYEHPRKYEDVTFFKNLGQYIAAHGKLGVGENKHKVMSKLIEKNIEDDEVVNSYDDLRDSCHNARYINYEVGEQRLEMALKGLETIKNHCV